MGSFANVGNGFIGSQHYNLLLLLFANLLFGAVGVVTRILSSEYGVTMESITFLRQLYSTTILGVIFLIVGRKLFVFVKKSFLLLAFMGVIKALSDYLLFTSYESIPIGMATLMQMTAPFFTIIIMFFFFRENILFRSIIAIVLGTLGCILCTFGITGSVGAAGIAYAILSGFACSIYIIIADVSGKMGNKPSTTLFYTSLFGTLMFLPPACRDYTDLPSLFNDMEPIGLFIILAAFLTLLPFYILFRTVTKLGPAKTAIIGMSEFVFSTIFGIIFHNDLITLPHWMGMISIVSAFVIMNVDFSKRSAKLERFLEKIVLNAPVSKKGRKRITGR